MLAVEVVETGELGDRSYVVHDGSVAVVVDPQRDLDRVEEVLREHGLELVLVCETHRHNDYVTGGFALAGRAGVEYVVPAGEDVAFDRRSVSDGDVLEAGQLRIEVVATPGHTDGHVAYVVRAADGPAVVFTGGSLLFGSVGRTDLVDPDRTDELTRKQYASVRRLAGLLDDDAAVYPTHGFGSFCSSGAATGAANSTIGQERTSNDALVEDDEDAFVDKLTAGLTAYPAYYAHMGALNAAGPGAADLSPVAEVDPDTLRKRIAAGEWVVDLRAKRAFAAGHVSGTVGVALTKQFATYLGWTIPWGTPVTLLGETADDVAAAQRQLARIGIDRPAGSSTAPLDVLAAGEPLRSYPAVSFADAAALPAGATVLDVRRGDERAAGGIPGSVHVPLQNLQSSLDELPDGQLWVHCASGFRASIGASLLDRAGRDVVLIDDDYSNAVSAGLATG